jgi:hypothetical protein
MHKVLVQRSDCCNAEVLLGSKQEFPLGGRMWSQTYRTYACENCLMECDVVDVEVCEECGEAVCECNVHMSAEKAGEEVVGPWQ